MKKIIFFLFVFLVLAFFFSGCICLQKPINVIGNWVIEKNYSNSFLPYYEYFHINNEDTNSGNFNGTSDESYFGNFTGSVDSGGNISFSQTGELMFYTCTMNGNVSGSNVNGTFNAVNAMHPNGSGVFVGKKMNIFNFVNMVGAWSLTLNVDGSPSANYSINITYQIKNFFNGNNGFGGLLEGSIAPFNFSNRIKIDLILFHNLEGNYNGSNYASGNIINPGVGNVIGTWTMTRP